MISRRGAPRSLRSRWPGMMTNRPGSCACAASPRGEPEVSPQHGARRDRRRETGEDKDVPLLVPVDPVHLFPSQPRPGLAGPVVQPSLGRRDHVPAGAAGDGQQTLTRPPTAGAGTIISGTPSQQGTFTFTVDNVPFNNPGAAPSQGTYSITVDPPLPLDVVLPASGSTLSPGTVDVAYARNFF